MVVRTKAAPAKKTTARPAAKKAAAPAPARKATAARPAAKKAAPAPAKRSTGASEARKAQLAEARAKRGAKAAAPAVEAEVAKHPTRKDEITAHDVLRAYHTFNTLYVAWLGQQGEEIAEVLDFVAPILPEAAGRPKKSPATRAKVTPQEREEEQKYYDRESFEKYHITEIREIATDLAAAGVITETKVKSKILAEMEEAGLFRTDSDDDSDEGDEEYGEDAEETEEEDDDESDDDEDDDEESDDDTETAFFTREELEGYKLKQLQEIAEANELDWNGLSKADLIDLLVPEDDEEEEDDEEDEDEEGEELEIDLAALKKASVEELLDICEQAGWDVPRTKRKNKAAIIEIIEENVANDEEEDEDE